MIADHDNPFNKPRWYYENKRPELLKYIPKYIRTSLEFGCGFGEFSALLKKKFGTETWAVEIDRLAAQEAAKKLDRVLNTDANESLKDLPEDYFDCIIIADVLEHLVDPYSLLRSVKKKLNKNGVIVTSIPNVRYCRNVFNLAVRGNWDYEDAGILDKTHLRFFTRKSILKTFDQLGFEVLLIEGILPTQNKMFKLLNILLFRALEDSKYWQFITVARPRNS